MTVIYGVTAIHRAVIYRVDCSLVTSSMLSHWMAKQDAQNV